MTLLPRLRKLVRTALGCKCLEDYSIEERRRMWPAARPLAAEHIANCRLVENRAALLELMPKGSVCAEIGIWRCEFSALILSTVRPARLHLIDIDPAAIAIARAKFPREIADGTVVLHQGDSAPIVRSLPARSFDWIYVDGDHSRAGARRDLEAARERLKPGGLLVVNDYIYFSPSDFAKYGVVEAVHDFLVEHGFEMVYLALQGRTYHDVVLREIGPAGATPASATRRAEAQAEPTLDAEAVR